MQRAAEVKETKLCNEDSSLFGSGPAGRLNTFNIQRHHKEINHLRYLECKTYDVQSKNA